MPNQTDLAVQVAELRAELAHVKEDMEELQEWQSYCNKMAVKWGLWCLGLLGMGTAVGSGSDKLKKLVMGFLQ